jgi:hypothetical protein
MQVIQNKNQINQAFQILIIKKFLKIKTFKNGNKEIKTLDTN